MASRINDSKAAPTLVITLSSLAFSHPALCDCGGAMIVWIRGAAICLVGGASTLWLSSSGLVSANNVKNMNL